MKKSTEPKSKLDYPQTGGAKLGRLQNNTVTANNALVKATLIQGKVEVSVLINERH